MTKARALLVAVLAVCVPSMVAANGAIHNLELVSDEVLAGSRMFAFLAHEGKGGGADLNGDGDANDLVPHVYDRESGETINLGLSAVRLKADGEILAFLVSELGEGVDLNGDGDTFDVIPHVFDRRDRSITSLGLHSGLTWSANRHMVAFIKNGFADPLYVYDTNRRELREVGFPGVRFFNAVGRHLVFQVDGWVHVHYVARDRTVETGLRLEPGAVSRVRSRAGNLALPVSESAMGGLDYNGDGDALDVVAHLFDLSEQSSTNSGTSVVGQGFGQLPIWAVGDRFLLWVAEWDEGGRDLNGDGDAADIVLHRLLADGTVINFALANAAAVRTLGQLAGFVVSEASQGDTDLNGDGDALDWVVHLYDASWDAVVNTGLAEGGILIERPRLWRRGAVVFVNESAQGGVDLNGDGQDGATVPVVVEIGVNGGPPSFMRFTNTGLARGSTDLYITRTGRYLVMSVAEIGQGIDLDGDGQLQSSVVHSVRLFKPGLRNWRLDDFLSRPVVGSGASVAVLAFERSGDLNGDGDDFDRVVHVGSVWPRR